ncbi:uncharacterized protein BJ171DRAFT_460358 [Polychytrium aggregatum]|uniref:uncharacterized protein n=1 Tax=Polychytrium aggregatum TaxID=110093 RepID=UPI0022FE8F78|nr:uncharacterized protein BJ171DRAFT_460358 [Polychytrium aggregatum]KAI9203522.1 hypothetical protein BJ171DRAFT_460358 [Polychytrium aggregatum]
MQPDLPPQPQPKPQEEVQRGRQPANRPREPRKFGPSPPPILRDHKNNTKYIRGELLGEGGFARCYKVQDGNGSGELKAAKVIPKASLRTEKQKNKLFSEIKIHRQMSHPNIVQFHHVFEDDNFVYMILELCENKTFVDLLKVRRRLTEPEVRYYMLRLLAALMYMHSQKVIHRDIKLGNIFLTKSMDLKIGDFGLAAILKHDGERKKTICGTPNYIAPEVLFDTQNGHSFEVDTWSLGVVMYTLLIGRPPFQTKEVKAIYKNIRDNIYGFPPQIYVSNMAKEIISSLLNTRPEHRPSISDVLDSDFFVREFMPAQIPITALTTAPQWEQRPTQLLQEKSQQPVYPEDEDCEPNGTHRAEDQHIVRSNGEAHQRTNGTWPQKPQSPYPRPTASGQENIPPTHPNRFTSQELSHPHQSPMKQHAANGVRPLGVLDTRGSMQSPSVRSYGVQRASVPENGARATRRTYTTASDPLDPPQEQFVRYPSYPGVAPSPSHHERDQPLQSEMQNLHLGMANPASPRVHWAEQQPHPHSYEPTTRMAVSEPRGNLHPSAQAAYASNGHRYASVPELYEEDFEVAPALLGYRRDLGLQRQYSRDPRLHHEEQQRLLEYEKQRALEEHQRLEYHRQLELEQQQLLEEKLALEQRYLEEQYLINRPRGINVALAREQAEALVEAMQQVHSERHAPRSTSPPRPPALESPSPLSSPGPSPRTPNPMEASPRTRSGSPQSQYYSYQKDGALPNRQDIPPPMSPARSTRPDLVDGTPQRVTTSQKHLGVLELIYHNVCQAIDAHEQGMEVPTNEAMYDQKLFQLPPCFIIKWIDYSNKYGLGYMLKDGSVGVHFNDSTSMIMSSNNVNFDYLHKASNQTTLLRKSYMCDSYPAELEKKVTLLKHFKTYMEDNLYKTPEQEQETPEPKASNLDFLTKYLRTKQGVVFRFSNHTLQFNFSNRTKLILSHEGRSLTWVDEDRRAITLPLVLALERSDPVIHEKAKYVRDVIGLMISRKQKRTQTGHLDDRVE